jgi:hypothetical protein
MNSLSLNRCFLTLVLSLSGVVGSSQEPIADQALVFAERDGLLAVEAEHFARQTATEQRAFYLVTAAQRPQVEPDGDLPHVAGASGGAYLEILPDTRRNHGDKLIKGENFSPQPGQLAVLTYNVHIGTPGRYYVWVRAFSTGSEDNGLHVGMDGTWPASGQRLQWCDGKRTWRWESKQRTEQEHCGEPGKIFLDIDKPGRHQIHFSMREDGFEFDKWLMTTDRMFARPDDAGPTPVVHEGKPPAAFAQVKPKIGEPAKANDSPKLVMPRQADGNGQITVSGELKVWHKVTLTLDGPYANEQDNQPNPFTDYRMSVAFQHDDGTTYLVPGYFAADGNAANSSARAGTKWRAHFAPDRTGHWKYSVSFVRGTGAALDQNAAAKSVAPGDGQQGELIVAATDKQGRDLRASGRLAYVGKRYLQHLGNKQFFLKAGADAPETLLGYADFDGTVAGKPSKVPLKTFAPHLQDWRPGDPTWKEGQGKGLIGAVNYLSGTGCNAFSFLTYNAGGDGDNVWPFTERNDKLHYDCSKLDQWGIVFDHGTAKGMYLHFKMQETENDDNQQGKKRGEKQESLDGGNLGIERKLYCRELIARFGHNLALNWNLGEENTQTTAQQTAMIDYIAELDAYDHNIVVHTFPSQQDKVYRPLLGDGSKLTGVSLQNSDIRDTHSQTVKWVQASTAAGKPWIVAFDESGSAAHGQCPDLGYRGFDGKDKTGKMIYTPEEVRRQTLWGTLMGGGAGVEYYFGYQFVENDLTCEDWRSRDQSWKDCRIALDFFRESGVPMEQTVPADELVGNHQHNNSCYCLAIPNQAYLVYLPGGGPIEIDLRKATGEYQLELFNPRTGQTRPTDQVVAAGKIPVLRAPDDKNDWLLVLRRK